jgi:hypothetical protein
MLLKFECIEHRVTAIMWAHEKLEGAFTLVLFHVAPLDCDFTAKYAFSEAVRALLDVVWEVKLIESAEAARVWADMRIVLTLILLMLLLIHLKKQFLAAPHYITTGL